jgi:hypothetical protein
LTYLVCRASRNSLWFISSLTKADEEKKALKYPYNANEFETVRKTV